MRPFFCPCSRSSDPMCCCGAGSSPPCVLRHAQHPLPWTPVATGGTELAPQTLALFFHFGLLRPQPASSGMKTPTGLEDGPLGQCVRSDPDTSRLESAAQSNSNLSLGPPAGQGSLSAYPVPGSTGAQPGIPFQNQALNL